MSRVIESHEREKTHKKEIVQAESRIGPSPEDEVRWLLRFHEDNLEQMSTGDCLNRQYECLVFAKRRKEGLPTHSEDAMYNWPFPEASELPSFHESIVRVVSAIMEKEPEKQYVGFELNLSIYINGFLYSVNAAKEWQFVSTSENRLHVFQFALLNAVRPFAHLIHRCPECQKLFLAERANQEYDTVQCQSRVATRRYRETHGLTKSSKRVRPPKPTGGKHAKKR